MTVRLNSRDDAIVEALFLPTDTSPSLQTLQLLLALPNSGLRSV